MDFIKVKDLCSNKYYTTQDLRKKLDNFFRNDMIFNDLVYGVKKVYIENNNDSDKDERDCRDKSSTLSLF